MARLIAATEYASDAFECNAVLLDVLDDGTSCYRVVDSKGEITATTFVPFAGKGSQVNA
jgi:hypothetical protein